MWILGLLAVDVANADPVVLAGEQCSRAGCSRYSITLFDTSYFTDTLGRTGTWTMTESSKGRYFNWVIPGSPTLRGSILEGPDDCWKEATSPLNPQLGSVNVCLVAPSLHAVRHYTQSCEGDPLFVYAPATGEDGHWTAGRITPDTAGGLWVHRVRYYLTANVSQCGSFAHRVQLFIGASDAEPSDSPSVIYEFDVDESMLPAGDGYIELELPDPLLVEGDESLFVSVEQIYVSNDDRTCMAYCYLDPLEEGYGYWSNSATTPYSWQDLFDFDIKPPMVSAYGIVAGP